MHSITLEVPCARGWRVGSLDTVALFSYFKGPFKQEDLTPGVTYLVASVCEEVVAAWQRQGQQEHEAVNARSKLRALVNELYYRVLQFVMQELYPCTVEDNGRQKRKAVSPAAHQVLQRRELHMGVLHCVLSLVCYELGITGCDITTILNTNHCMLAVWEATRWFDECFNSPSTGCSMSQPCTQLLAGIRQAAEEGMVLQHGSSFFDAVFQGGGFAYADSSMCTDSSIGLVQNFIKSVGQSVARQLEAALHVLMTRTELTWHMGKLQLWRTCQMAADLMLLHRFDILFDVHQAVVVAALLYGCFRVYKDQVDKASLKLISSSVESTWLGVPLPAGTFTTVRLRQSANNGEYETTAGDLRAYYNQVFCHQCGDLLRTAAQHAAAELGITTANNPSISNQAAAAPDAPCVGPAAFVMPTADAAGPGAAHQDQGRKVEAVTAGDVKAEPQPVATDAYTPGRRVLQPVAESAVSERVNRGKEQHFFAGSCVDASKPVCQPDLPGASATTGKKRLLGRLKLVQQLHDDVEQYKENMPELPAYKKRRGSHAPFGHAAVHVTGVLVPGSA